MVDLSIIVPAYNVEKYLEQCVKSLIPSKKSKITYEILLIENNSTDNTLKECYKLAKNHQNIRVLPCKKQGLSESRNFGLKKSKGKYVWFVDSDDYVKAGSTDAIAQFIKDKKADVIMIMAEKVNERGGKWQGANAKLFVIEPDKDPEWDKRFAKIGIAAWQAISKREFLIKNNLFFDEGIIHEDMALMSSFIIFTKNIVLCREAKYYYRQRSGSILHQKKWNAKEFDIFKALTILKNRYKKAKMLDKYRDEVEYFFIWNLLDDAARTFKRYKEGKLGYKKIRQTMRREFPHWRRNKYFRKQPLMVRLRCYTAFYGIVW